MFQELFELPFLLASLAITCVAEYITAPAAARIATIEIANINSINVKPLLDR